MTLFKQRLTYGDAFDAKFKHMRRKQFVTHESADEAEPAQIPERSRPVVLLLLFLVALEAAVFLLPYRFPVSPSIALSYQVGYSNRAALVIFLLGSVCFAVYARGGIGRVHSSDSTLHPSTGIATSLLVLGMCLVRSYMLAGSEALYTWHRQELLLAGRHLYTQTDYFYGPCW